MTTKEEQAFRDFVHTVDVLTASALAEHERARAAQPTMPAKLVRNTTYAAVAAALALVMAIGLPAYLTSVDRGDTDRTYPTAMSRPDTERAPERARQAALEAEAELRRRQLAPDTVDARRMEEQRIAALEEARRKAESDEARRMAEAAAVAKRREEMRIAALEESRRMEEKRKEEERLRLAGIPDDAKRAEFVRRVQLVLKQSRCYGGSLTGRSEDAQEGLDKFVENANRRGKATPGRIELAKASVDDLETWLKDADAMKDGVCAPLVKPAATAKARKQRDAPARQQYTAPRQPSYQGGDGSGGGGVGVIQGIR